VFVVVVLEQNLIPHNSRFFFLSLNLRKERERLKEVIKTIRIDKEEEKTIIFIAEFF
jgi:hypothetical protein